MFETIVHPTDLSEASIPALKTAHQLAKELKTKLIVCFIAHPPLVASGDELMDPTTGETRNIQSELESHQPQDSSVDSELKIVVADHSAGVKKLLPIVEEMDCDLLVLGMHKRSGVAGWFGSTITEEVVRRAECTVMVVKHHGTDTVTIENDDAAANAP